MKYLNVFKILTFSIIFEFISCNYNINSNNKTLKVHEEKEVNYLVYMAADNNLERFGIKNIKALQEIGSSNNSNIIVLFDRSPGYDKSEDNRKGTDLFYITKNPNKMNDDIIFEYNELDMTNSETLYDFLSKVNKYFPARHTILNIWSHGRGVYPDGIISNDFRSVIEDYSTGYGANKAMPIYKLASSIKKYEENYGKYIDIIQFDCCDMQMIEVSYELKNLTDYVVGAETQILGIGSDYKNIASYLNTIYNFDSKEFAEYLVETFSEYQNDFSSDFSYSLVNTKSFNIFMPMFNSFCENLILYMEDKFEIIKDIRAKLTCTDESYPEFVDLSEFINSVNFFFDNTELKIAFKSLVPNCKNSTLYKNLFGGCGINFPHTNEEKSYYFKSNSDYEILNFYEKSLWDEFLIEFCKHNF